MTILAGIISRIHGVSIPERTCATLRRVISRYPGDQVIEFKGSEWFLAKVDMGIFDSPAVRVDQGQAISMLAGEPLLTVGHADKVRNRMQDLELLHQNRKDSDWSILANCKGSFCGIHYNQIERALSLFTDKLGLRPIYYWADSNFAVYATALRILEELDEVPKKMDVRGVTEIACFGFPLAERTAYEGISTLRAGETVRITEQEITKSEYWRWDRLSPPPMTHTALSEEAHRRFMSAIERRVGTERVTAAFLSGGLDSRSIVSALRSLGVDVHTINFAQQQTQDEVFAREVSKVLSTTHHNLIKDAESIGDKGQVYNQGVVRAWFDSDFPKTSSSQRRYLIWSGDGGSVAVGHVYLNTEIVELAQSGKEEAAIDAFLCYNKVGITGKLFQPNIADIVVSTPKRGIRDELARLECQDRGRAFHLFLMLNDQRRHLSDFFENIDLGRLEFQLPFFDSDLLELILSSPVNDFLGHRFYMEWLKSFSPIITSVPWQAYPGHVPCPLPIPENLRYQWAPQYYDHATRRRIKQAVLEQASSLLGAASFPDKIIDKGRLRLAVWLTRLGMRNYDYLIEAAAIYWKHWIICQSATAQR